MKFSRFVVGVVTALTVAACGSSKPGPDGPGIKAKGSSALWTLAPADSVAGVVLADGTLATGRQWFVELMRIADARPESKMMADEIRGGLQEMPFNPLDDSSLASAGLDIAKGAAVFVNEQEELVVVLPVSDRKAFAGLVGGSTTMEGGIEIETYEDGGMQCKMHESRYVCAKTAERLAMVGASPTNSLAEAASALPADMQGQAQMLVDASRYRLGSKLDGIDRYITNAGILAASATMARGKLTVRAHLPGELVGEGKKLAAASSMLAGKVGSERPSSFFRVRMDPSAFPVPNEQIVPGVNLGDIVRSMTGEMIAFSHAGAAGSASMQLGLSSPDPLRQLIKMGCDMSGMVPFLTLKSEASACKGSMSLDAVPGPISRMLHHSKVDLGITVDADRLDARMSMGPAGPVTNAPSPSKLGAELLSNSWNVAMWAEGLSPIYINELVKTDMVRQMAGKELAMALWLVGHVYEAGMGVGMRDDGVHAMFEVTTFAAASDEDYAAYEAALGMAVDGKMSDAAEALKAAAAKNADGMLARQVGLRSAAWLGAFGVGGMVWGTMGREVEMAPPAMP